MSHGRDGKTRRFTEVFSQVGGLSNILTVNSMKDSVNKRDNADVLLTTWLRIRGINTTKAKKTVFNVIAMILGNTRI